MKVKLATSRGFCFGVEDAIELAEAAVDEHGAGRVVALGPVIHNKQVVNKLEEAGLNQSGDLETIDPIRRGLDTIARRHAGDHGPTRVPRSRGG